MMVLDDFYGVAIIVAERKEYIRFLIISTQKSSYLLSKRMVPTASDTFDNQPHNIYFQKVVIHLISRKNTFK